MRLVEGEGLVDALSEVPWGLGDDDEDNLVHKQRWQHRSGQITQYLHTETSRRVKICTKGRESPLSVKLCS